MIARSFLRSAVAAAAGFGLGAALFWALLNVPESNVLALMLSALLVLLIAITAGATTAIATAFALDVAPGQAVRRGLRALPSFAVGLAMFAILWWLTGRVDEWWAAHRGEAAALLLRYLGVTRTAPLDRMMAWFTWLVRWALGLSVIAGVTATGSHGGLGSIGRGLRLAVRPLPLGAAAIAAIIASEGLWRMALWRPGGVPPNWLEPTVAGVKLVVLYLLTMAIVAAVLRMYARMAPGPT